MWLSVHSLIDRIESTRYSVRIFPCESRRVRFEWHALFKTGVGGGRSGMRAATERNDQLFRIPDVDFPPAHAQFRTGHNDFHFVANPWA